MRANSRRGLDSPVYHVDKFMSALTAIHGAYRADAVSQYDVSFARYLAIRLNMPDTVADAIAAWFLSRVVT
jgi:hypothetical protein